MSYVCGLVVLYVAYRIVCGPNPPLFKPCPSLTASHTMQAMLHLWLALLGCSVTVHVAASHPPAGAQANHSHPRLGNYYAGALVSAR